MLRASFIGLIVLTLATPSGLFAGNNLEILEQVAAASEKVQPGLENYQATVQTSRIEEMMTSLTSGMPADVLPPPTPVIIKLWQRNGKGLVSTRQTQLPPYVDKMVKQLSANMAVELNQILLPIDRTEQRGQLVKDARVKSSEVSVADDLILHLEILFAKPTDLNEAFYTSGMRLPQKQVNSLIFDIDARTNTISEMRILAENELQLSVGIRYLAVAGGYIPKRFRITSPGGKIDDLFEVKFVKIDSYFLPASMLRVIRRPELEDSLEVFFKDHRVNQPIPEDIQTRLDQQ
jgi:hypothetical protein